MLPLAFLLAIRITPDAAGVQYRQPKLAVVENQIAVTFGSGNAVYFVSSVDSGRSFSSPVKVAETGALMLGHHRGPRVAVTPGAIVISAIAASRPRAQDANLLAWRSTDGGKTWSAAHTLNEVAGSAAEGLHAMAAGGKAPVFATWLDLRNRRTELYGARSADGGASWSKNVLVYQSPDGHICECCHPSAAVDAKGNVYVMWRNWLGGARDMYLARSTDGGLTFAKAEKLGEGTWPLNACPMDGGALAVDPKGAIASIWRRAQDIFLARPGQAETRLGAGKDAAVAIGPDGVYAAWAEAKALQIQRPGKSHPEVLAAEGAAVQLAGSGPVVAAWESNGAIVIETLR